MAELPMPPKPGEDFSDPIRFPAGVVLRPRTEAQPAYRVESRDPPSGLPGVKPGKRVWTGSSRDLDDAYRNACARSRELFETARHLARLHKIADQQSTHGRSEDSALAASQASAPHQLWVPNGQSTWSDVAEDYLDPSHHSRWTEDYAKQQASLARNWLLSDRILVPGAPGSGRARIPFRDVPVRATVDKQLTVATSYAYAERAYDTYKNVHKLVVSLLVWARRQGHLDVTSAQFLLDHFELGLSSDGDDEHVTEDMIPPLDRVMEFREAHMKIHDGWWYGLEIDFLCWEGLREGEMLALAADRRWRDLGTDSQRVQVFERSDKNGRARPPKWRKKRWATVFDFVSEDVQRRREEVGERGLMFPSPTGLRYGTSNWRRRRFVPTAEAVNWPERDNYCPHKGHPESVCKGQNRRRWQWPPHAFRHFAVTWVLGSRNPPDGGLAGLGWDDEDAAEHFGHRSGRQLREQYAEVLPDRHRRRCQSSTGVDPRRITN